jgi:hypothetical protein
MNLALILGLFRYLGGIKTAAWSRTERSWIPVILPPRYIRPDVETPTQALKRLAVPVLSLSKQMECPSRTRTPTAFVGLSGHRLSGRLPNLSHSKIPPTLFPLFIFAKSWAKISFNRQSHENTGM